MTLHGRIWASDENFTIHVLNNLTEEYDAVLDGSENCPTSSSSDDKLNTRYEKNTQKREEI